MTRWIIAQQSSLSLTVSWSLPKFMSIMSVMLSKHRILCHPLLLPSVLPSIRAFSIESALHIKWPISISPSNDYSELISLGLNGWISLLSKRLARIFFSTIFESIDSSALSLLYGPTLISIHDYWENQSFD